jgi:hypothetical protein
MMHESHDQVPRIRVVERAVRLLAAIFWGSAALFAASLFAARRS